MAARYCAVGNIDADDTCFTKKQLITIIKEYNKNNSNKIKYKSTFTKDRLHQLLTKKMYSKCQNTEYCILDQPFMKRNKPDHHEVYGPDRARHGAGASDPFFEIYYHTFKPVLPITKRNPFYNKTWLSSIDIVNVLRQYERRYEDFASFGPVPSNFEEVLHQIVFDVCKSHNTLEKMYKKGKKRIGMVINQDLYGNRGTHWVCVFIDLSDDVYSIEYFDSIGKEPLKSIKKYLNYVQTKLRNLNGKRNTVVKKINSKTHQKKNSECGIYCLYYIINRLNGASFEDITGKGSRRISDEEMLNYRFSLFRPPVERGYRM